MANGVINKVKISGSVETISKVKEQIINTKDENGNVIPFSSKALFHVQQVLTFLHLRGYLMVLTISKETYLKRKRLKHVMPLIQMEKIILKSVFVWQKLHLTTLRNMAIRIGLIGVLPTGE